LFDFNPKDIRKEIKKIEEYTLFIEEINEELKDIFSSLENIKLQWNKFLKKNPNVKNTFFEDDYDNKLLDINNIINNSLFKDLSKVTYEIEMLRKIMENTIKIVEKINIYIKSYIYIGEDSDIIYDKLKKMAEIKSYNSKSKYLEEYEEIFERIEEIQRRSLVSNAGVPVKKLSSRDNIYRYTIQFGDKIVAYDPFFKNSNLKKEDNNSFIYFDNFPHNGIFRGSEIVENFNLSNKYYDYLIEIKELMTKSFFIGMFVVFLTSAIALSLSSTLFNIFNLILVLSFFFAQPLYLKILEKKLSKKYNLYKPFLFTRIDFFYIVFGETIDIKLLIKKIIYEINSTLLNKDNFKKESQIVWREKYTLNKRGS
jgi:hypothetical protein